MANANVLEASQQSISSVESEKHYSLFERIAINHAHPTKLVLDLIGSIWMTYFLWENKFLVAIILGTGFALAGTILVSNAKTQELAVTPIGKYVIARMHPINLTCQMSGFLVSMYGVWVHVGWIILLGISLICLGHLWGWNRKIIP